MRYPKLLVYCENNDRYAYIDMEPIPFSSENKARVRYQFLGTKLIRYMGEMTPREFVELLAKHKEYWFL